MFRQDTDVLGTNPWHPSLPQEEERPRRVRQRPHPRYDSPNEMWAWHWVRMRIILTWALVLTICLIVITAGIVIFSELT